MGTIAIIFFYLCLFFFLRRIFRQFEKDIALVTLTVSFYPALIIFILCSLKIELNYISFNRNITWLDSLFTTAIIITFAYWIWRLLTQVIFYSLRKWVKRTEIMWDNVLLPLLEAATPILIIIISLTLILQFSFGIDLSGIWVALGGASFIIGFATKDILANFFSGIVLLIDTPFQFGDVLQLENGNLGILQKIGLRVTQLYQFDTHTEAYIPNSLLQAQNIVNLSRPIAPIHYTVPVTFLSSCDFKVCHQTMEEIILAHPDTIGDIETKLKFLDKYFNENELKAYCKIDKQNGCKRLIAEQEVNFKLEEIEESLEALVLTLKFFEKDGLDLNEIATVQDDYQAVLDLVGLEFVQVKKSSRKSILSRRKRKINRLIRLEETNSSKSLISLIREWYRLKLQDPNIVDRDKYILPKTWEYQIELLKKRFARLLKHVINPERVETRLDDYVKELIIWLKSRFKQARDKCYNPDVQIEGNLYGSSAIFVQFNLNYYVDDIRLEDGKRGKRVKSEIYYEILNHLQSYIV